MLWIRYLQTLVGEHRWSTSLAMDQNVGLCHRESVALVYQALLSEFAPKDQGIFSGDRIESTEPKYYSNIATCIRALLPLSTLRIQIIDDSLLSLLGLYYGSLHGDTGLDQLAYAGYTKALGQYSRLLIRFLSQDAEVSTSAYQAFLYTSIIMQMFEHLRGVATHSTDYQLHMSGALKALRCCGPQTLSMSLGMQKTFCSLREVAVFAAMEQREQMFLAEENWLQIPFQNFDKSMRDRLTAIGVHIPGLLQSSDAFSIRIANDSSLTCSEAGMSLLTRVAEIQGRLKSWLCMLESTTSKPLYWSRNLPTTHTYQYRDFECTPKYSNTFHQLCFLSGPTTGLLVHHWTFALQLSMISIELQHLLLKNLGQSPEREHIQESLARDIEKERELADETAKLILAAEPYLSSCFEGLVCLQPPLRIVAKYFEELHAAALTI